MFVRGKAGPKICGANQGDALPAIEEVRPQERHRWETGLQNADPGLVDDISRLVAARAGASLVRTGKPRTTLEDLFLRETSKADNDE